MHYASNSTVPLRLARYDSGREFLERPCDDAKWVIRRVDSRDAFQDDHDMFFGDILYCIGTDIHNATQSVLDAGIKITLVDAARGTNAEISGSISVVQGLCTTPLGGVSAPEDTFVLDDPSTGNTPGDHSLDPCARGTLRAFFAKFARERTGSREWSPGGRAGRTWTLGYSVGRFDTNVCADAV